MCSLLLLGYVTPPAQKRVCFTELYFKLSPKVHIFQIHMKVNYPGIDTGSEKTEPGHSLWVEYQWTVNLKLLVA